MRRKRQIHTVLPDAVVRPSPTAIRQGEKVRRDVVFPPTPDGIRFEVLLVEGPLFFSMLVRRIKLGKVFSGPHYWTSQETKWNETDAKRAHARFESYLEQQAAYWGEYREVLEDNN